MLARVAFVALLIAASSCNGDEPGPALPISPIPADLGDFRLSSPAFPDGGPIPDDFTCNGANVPPPLEWTGVPDGATELALTLLDPDAPEGVFTHWTVFGIDPSTTGFAEGEAPGSALEGMNDFGEPGYGGPCPPPGESHRYVFTLAVLSHPSALPAGAPPSAVDAELQAATATTTLTGVYPG